MEISKICVKPPQFDGKSSWVNYLRQLEAAAKENGWSLAEKATALTLALRGDATDILQTLSLEEQDDYHQLVRHLEMRYGQSHLEHVYHSQLKNRYQKSNESLQEFEANIARIVSLAYSSTPENVMERLAVQSFLDGLRDTETRRALTLAHQENDQNLKPIVNWKKEDRKPTWEEVSRYSPTVKSYWAQWNSLVLSDGLLKRVLEKSDGTEERKQLIVPRNRVPEVLEEIHNGSTGGHLGVTKTLGKVRERFYWVNCTTDVKDWCKKCVVCGASNGPQRHPKAPMRQYNVDTYRSSIHETSGQTPASIVMGRELHRPCDLKFGCTPGDDVAGEDYVSTLRQRMDDIHERVRSNIQGASDRMKETYDINANDGRYQPGNRVWLYNPQRRVVVGYLQNFKSPGKKLPRGKPRVVHFNRLAPFAGSNDEQAEARVRTSVRQTASTLFEEFMLLHSNGQKDRYGLTREEPRDLFQAPADSCHAHCLRSSRSPNVPRDCTYLQEGVWTVGGVTQTKTRGWTSPSNHGGPARERELRLIFGEQLSHHKPTYQNVWDTLAELRNVLLSQNISSLAIPKIASVTNKSAKSREDFAEFNEWKENQVKLWHSFIKKNTRAQIKTQSRAGQNCVAENLLAQCSKHNFLCHVSVFTSNAYENA
ncbi:hypothetical protein NQ318_022686 [Aromia moschata]|uniref:Integrase zinc-binding domain-containing protein n=1 Tax=Aromia moschata TaxID=1265417 RepID=A0AAV8X5H6_9CUCU|nr:hypothetical protein NQ318_022686 [Aromia moschata]